MNVDQYNADLVSRTVQDLQSELPSTLCPMREAVYALWTIGALGDSLGYADVLAEIASAGEHRVVVDVVGEIVHPSAGALKISNAMSAFAIRGALAQVAA